MADIPVEHRPDLQSVTSLPTWAGLLGLAALASLIWLLFSLGANVATQSDAETADTPVSATLDQPRTDTPTG
ncbi:hypothetical protein [uncultured Algimonas sp.]|uniref:hypothetical protein n=1 Tax=uncultured Algimonas sp. TaxID=1547920 RepID=UPI0026379698|nr:hypothetical protein [uncultured Algimonas sp.]